MIIQNYGQVFTWDSKYLTSDTLFKILTLWTKLYVDVKGRRKVKKRITSNKEVAMGASLEILKDQVRKRYYGGNLFMLF